MNKHFEDCSAPICQELCENDLVWYAGEEVCKKIPKTNWQKKQILINRETKKGTFKHIDTPYNIVLLKNSSI